MRVLILPAFSVALMGAGEPPSTALDNPAYSTPPERWETVDDALEDSVVKSPEDLILEAQEACRDRITETREATGQPPLLDREPASPEKPHAIYAVDRRQDGCSVMVTMGNREDIRPLPAPAEGPMLQRIPVEAGQ